MLTAIEQLEKFWIKQGQLFLEWMIFVLIIVIAFFLRFDYEYEHDNEHE